MKAKENQLVFLPVALIVGGALFAFGHSLRPGPVPEPSVTMAADKSFATSASTRASVLAAPSIATVPADHQLTIADQTEIRSGIILSMNGERFILRDEDNNTWYHLDDQKAAGSFLGKKVRVIGEVDPATDVIHVQSIRETKV
jgi:uncharacterized protein YdeI (BOF family)